MRPRTCWACINSIIRSRWPPRCASRGFKPVRPPAQFEPMLAVQIATCWARAGMGDKAAQTLAALRERSPDARVVVAGQEKELFRDSKDALAWLTRTWVRSSNFTRWAPSNGPCSAAAPIATRSAPAAVPLLNRRWGVPVSDDNGSIAALLKQLQQTAIDQGGDLLPACCTRWR